MEKWWFNSILLNRKLEYRCKFKKSMESLGPIENTSLSEEPKILSDIDKKIHSCIESYFHSQICIDSWIFDDIDKYNESYFYSFFFGKKRNRSESENSNFRFITSTNDTNDSDSTIGKNYKNLHESQKMTHLWSICPFCSECNFTKVFQSQMNICYSCGYHFQMDSSERIEFSIDSGTWNPMDEDIVFRDRMKFHSREHRYKDRIAYFQRKTGLTEAVQTGTGQLNGIPVAIGIMDFNFMGGSMGSVVGEKITRLVEYATNQLLPLILVCSSGGARMQEGGFSLMQMAKISSALYYYQTIQKLFYVSILTSPTTGGVTASFGMLGDIIIAEPKAYIGFAGKRIIKQTLSKRLSNNSQLAEYLLYKGFIDKIVPRNFLKEVVTELFQFHNFFSLAKNERNYRIEIKKTYKIKVIKE